LNKVLGTKILISEATAEQVRNRIHLSSPNRVRLSISSDVLAYEVC
jgi:hypothetical protein